MKQGEKKVFVQKNTDTLQTTIDIISSLPGFQTKTSELLGFETVEKCIPIDTEVFCQGFVTRSSSAFKNGTMDLRDNLDGTPAFCEYGNKAAVVRGLEDTIYLSSTLSTVFFAFGFSLIIPHIFPSYPSTSGASSSGSTSATTSARDNRFCSPPQ